MKVAARRWPNEARFLHPVTKIKEAKRCTCMRLHMYKAYYEWRMIRHDHKINAVFTTVWRANKL
jgi:hypothetical protein